MKSDIHILQLKTDMVDFIISQNNRATKTEIVKHLQTKYPEHEIRACMTPLLIAGILEEHVVYSVVYPK